MTQFSEYFSSLSLLRSAFRDLESIFEKLNPNQPLLRTRLVAVSSDLECISELCGNSFLECTSWSRHVSERQYELEAKVPVLSTQEYSELQEYQIRLYNGGKPLSEAEDARYTELSSKMQNYSQEFSSAIENDIACGLDAHVKKSEAILKANVRAFLFSCRSYQDAIYALYLVSKRKQPGQHSSVHDGLKGAEFRSAIAAIPGYVDWFNKLRELRNLAKVGATCGVGLGGQEVTVSYDDARNDRVVKVGGNDFSFLDLSRSMEMSARFTKLVTRS
ncbi:hypothetical protein K3722_06240 [Leisingera caerulea]|uniref:HEPN AbiU2-like domain-containing protein n=1 Tax=Leisingera caerulea TaxID=506591 RepID=A0ABY5X044_LEICA|nr:hypothetical protein [Leisingera caerulea]UWQ59723.1 hypothetical protein K3722_06240 [Leisingera caerulea]